MRYETNSDTRELGVQWRVGDKSDNVVLKKHSSNSGKNARDKEDHTGGFTQRETATYECRIG